MICGRYHEVAVGGSINYKRDFVGTGLHLRGRSRSHLGAASLLHQSSQHHAGTTRTYPSRVFKAEPGRADKPFRPSRARRARRTAVMLASGLNLTKPGGSPPQPRGNPELPRSPTVASPARWSAILKHPQPAALEATHVSNFAQTLRTCELTIEGSPSLLDGKAGRKLRAAGDAA